MAVEFVTTADGCAYAIHVYVDGVEAATTAMTFGGASAPVVNAQGYRFGSADTTGATDKNLAGSIDEIAVYGTPLSADRVLAHYAATGAVTRVGYTAPASVAVSGAPSSSTLTIDKPAGVVSGDLLLAQLVNRYASVRELAREHRDLLAAIEAGDPEQAEAAIRGHLGRATVWLAEHAVTRQRTRARSR